MKIIIKNSNLVFEKFEQQYQTYSLNETDRWVANGAILDYVAYMDFPKFVHFNAIMVTAARTIQISVVPLKILPII